MTVDNLVNITAIISSFIALYFSLKKQKHEENKLDSEASNSDANAANLDADTITTLYSLIREQEKVYKEYKIEQEALIAKLQKDFVDYKIAMNSQLEDVVNENIKLRRWAKKLAAQLEHAGIVPTPFEL